MKRIVALLTAACFLLVVTARSASAQTGISVSDTSFKIDFPIQMTFHLSAKSSVQITAVTLAVRFPSTGTTTRIPAKFTQGSEVDIPLVWNLGSSNISEVGGYVAPGAAGDYSWHIEDAGGDKVDTPASSFKVVDNRITWKDLQNDRVALSWDDGDATFGQQIFDRANKTLDAIEQDIGATLSSQAHIFIWGNRAQFLSALPPGRQEWAGGSINEAFGTVFIDANADMLDYALMVTPHELAHLVIAQALKGPYENDYVRAMPLWMNEGLAVYHEFVPPKDEPRFDAALHGGIQRDTIFRLRALSDKFPDDASVVDMAYGESFSVVDFMIRQYGRDKMKQLFTLFKTGTTADEAFQQVLGVDEDGLENLWRKSVGAQQKNYAKQATATPGAVPTMSLSSADTPVAATATPPSIALQQSPTLPPIDTPTPQSSSGVGGGGGFCGGLFGGAGLVGFGLWKVKKRKK